MKLPLGTDYLPDVAQLPELITPGAAAFRRLTDVERHRWLPDLAQAIRIAHANGIIVMVDGAQGVVHFGRCAKLDIDFYAFSGHKLYGPTGNRGAVR